MCIIIEYQIHVMVPAWHTVNKLFSKLGINDYIFAIHNMLTTKYTLSYPEVKPNMVAVGCLVPQSCPFLRNPMDSLHNPPAGLLCSWDFLGKNVGVGCHFLLRRIFLTQGLNLHLLHCRQILYWLSPSEAQNPAQHKLCLKWYRKSKPWCVLHFGSFYWAIN